MKLSMTKPVTELPTERQAATGSLVWTGSVESLKLPNRYGVFVMPSLAKMSPSEFVENNASAASRSMFITGPGSRDSAAPNMPLPDSAIDCDTAWMLAPVTLPAWTAPSHFTA